MNVFPIDVRKVLSRRGFLAGTAWLVARGRFVATEFGTDAVCEEGPGMFGSDGMDGPDEVDGVWDFRANIRSNASKRFLDSIFSELKKHLLEILKHLSFILIIYLF